MAENKDKKAMINDGKNIELEGVTVINEGISLAETKKEETKEETAPAVNEDVVVPSDSSEVSVFDMQNSIPNTPTGDIPFAPVDLPIGDSVVTGELPISPLEDEKQEDYSQSVISVNASQPSFAGVASVGANDFDSSFGAVSYEKVESTIVTPEDARLAREAYLEKAAELYDKGPGNQIEILMRVASQMDELLEVIGNQGFVSGPNHEAIKKARLEYRGLVEKDNSKTFSDNQGSSFGGMNY